MEVAANRPQSVEELKALERVNLDRESVAGVVAAIRGAMALPKSELPAVPEPVVLPRGIGPTVDLLRVLLKYRSEESDVAQRLLASTSDLERSRSTTRPTCRPCTAGGARSSATTPWR